MEGLSNKFKPRYRLLSAWPICICNVANQGSMAQLEDLKPGQQVSGILPNQSITVVDVKWHGGDAVELFYKRADGEAGTRLVFREEAAEYHVDTAPRTWRFDG